MQNKIIVILLSLLVFGQSYAQDLKKEYQPIMFTGVIPSHFLKDMKETSQKEIESRKENDLSKKESKEFYIGSNEQLFTMLRSGNVYFNDIITNYVNEVAKELLKNEEDSLVKNLTFNVTKYPVPNAFCWRNGDIFINIGLFEYIDNEAQLAFILSHEIQHYKKEHSLNFYKKGVALKSKRKRRKRKEQTELSSVLKSNKDLMKEIEKMAFSKDQEYEADFEGFELYKKSKYSQIESVNVLNNLKKIGSQKDTIAIQDLSVILNNEYYKVDTSRLWGKGKKQAFYNAKDTTEEGEDKVIEELLASHPALDERIAIIEDEIDKENKGESFIISKQKFQLIKQIVKFEEIEFYYNNMYYMSTVTKSLELLKEYPDNQYLKTKIGEAFYKILRVKKSISKSKKTTRKKKKKKEVEINSHQEYLSFYIDKITTKSFEKLVYAYTKALAEADENNQYLSLLHAKVLMVNNKKSQAKRLFKKFNEKSNNHYNYAKNKENIK